MTFDHSLVWEMMASGQVPKGDTPAFIPKNIITRSLGPHPEVKVDLEGPLPLEIGDTFLVCSDGLSGQMSDLEIGLLLSSLTPAEAVRTLVALANLRGGPDNISVIVVRIKQAVTLSDAKVPQRASETGQGGGFGSVHPGVWVALGVCLLGAAGLAISDNLPAAVGAGLGAIAAGAVAIYQAMSQRTYIPTDWARSHLGKGPYTTTPCQPTAESIAPLAQMCKSLQEDAKRDGLQINWAASSASPQRGAAAQAAGNFPLAGANTACR